MDPWSKVEYSRIIREASMVVEKLPEVIPPSGKVPGRGLLALPILEARRRRNRSEIAKRGYVFEGFKGQRINRGRGSQGGHQGSRWPPGAAPPMAAPGGRLGPLAHLWLPPFAYLSPITGKPQEENPIPRTRLCSAAAALPKIGSTRRPLPGNLPE